MKPTIQLVLLLLAASASQQMSSAADDTANGATTFSAKCASCHTIGGGTLVGPDLSRVNKWPDADLTSTVQRMQSQAGPLSTSEIQSLVTFLKSSNPQADLKAAQEEQKAKASVEQDKEPASVDIGRDLFTGKASLQNGGMSCISCHSSGGAGGTVGLDLTQVANKMNETSLISACETTPFPVMKAAYTKHPITHQEARHLAKYFESTKQLSTKRSFEPAWLTGSAIALVTMGAVGVGYRNRNSGVHKKLRRR